MPAKDARNRRQEDERLTDERHQQTERRTETHLTDDPLTIPVHEEVLEPRLRTAETGRVRIRKRVETRPVEISVEAGHDEVSIERVPVDRHVDTMPAPWQDGDTLVIPVVEEVIVTETRLVVREEVRVTRRRVSEDVPIQGTVRREVVEFEEHSL